MIHLLVLGMGYAAGALALRLKQGEIGISGTVRSPESAAALAAQGIRPIFYQGGKPSSELREAISEASHLLVSLPPGESGDPFLATNRELVAASRHLRWIGYFSTIGVYGDCQGEWVDEASPCRPVNPRGVARVAAERAWTEIAAAKAVPLAIIRLAGIYGPGRNAFLNLANGTAHRIVKEGQVFNRIHVADIAAMTARMMESDRGDVFNLADDEPAPPQDVVAEAARLMGIPPPPEEAFAMAKLSPMARSFYGENKRVSNSLVKATLVTGLAYPTYRDGLAALWREGNWRG